ncbi:MAG: hypothetical protein M1835_003324, partial [Candelina submexicana]
MPAEAPTNTATYLVDKQARPLVVISAPYTPPGVHEIFVKNHAVAINPVDWFNQYVGNYQTVQ